MSSLVKFAPGQVQSTNTFVRELGHTKFTWNLKNVKEISVCKGSVTSPTFTVKTDSKTTSFNLMLSSIKAVRGGGAVVTFYQICLQKSSRHDVTVRFSLEGASGKPIQSTFYMCAGRSSQKKFFDKIAFKDKFRFVLDLTSVEIVHSK